MLGVKDGLKEGVRDGPADGCAEGDAEGLKDGPAEGDAEGLRDGAPVGTPPVGASGGVLAIFNQPEVVCTTWVGTGKRAAGARPSARRRRAGAGQAREQEERLRVMVQPRGRESHRRQENLTGCHIGRLLTRAQIHLRHTRELRELALSSRSL